MITLTHGLSGYVCGQVAMPLLRRHAPIPERAMLAAFTFGAMLPDCDFLARVLGGREAYFSSAWYGHRMASHSILGTLILGSLAASFSLAAGAAGSRSGPTIDAPPAQGPESLVGGRSRVIRRWAWIAGCCWAGGLLHLVGDIPTPGMPLRMFWPLDWRYGGLSHIGWFSPYLLMMFGASALASWALYALTRRLPAARAWLYAGLWMTNVATAFRWIEYMVVSRYESAAQYADYQRQLMPAALMDASSWLIFTLWRTLTR